LKERGMAHQFNPRHLAHLDNPIRRLMTPPKRTLRHLGVGSGDIVIDIGAGSGYFSLPAAELVGSGGRVYAVDVAPEAVALIARKARDRGISGLETVLSSGAETGLPPATGSFALMYTVLHEVGDKLGMLRSIHAALKTGGRIAIVEFGKNAVFGPPPSERIGENELLSILTQAGFSRPVLEHLGRTFYLATAVK
jgi:ubiquinone/menaquinone biosynthesis C-methylase UbiE